MRTSIAVLLAAISLFVGYSLRPVPVDAQVPGGDWLPFNIGEAVTLSVDLPDGTIACRVSRVQNGFVGCARNDQLRQPDRWINLRFVKEMTRGREVSR